MTKQQILKILDKREEYLKEKLKEEKENDIQWNFTKENIYQSLSEIKLIAMIIYCTWEE